MITNHKAPRNCNLDRMAHFHVTIRVHASGYKLKLHNGLYCSKNVIEWRHNRNCCVSIWEKCKPLEHMAPNTTTNTGSVHTRLAVQSILYISFNCTHTKPLAVRRLLHSRVRRLFHSSQETIPLESGDYSTRVGRLFHSESGVSRAEQQLTVYQLVNMRWSINCATHTEVHSTN